MLTLDPSSLDWSLAHLTRHSDTDKFPPPFELDVLARRWATSVRERLKGIDLTQHRWQGERKMLVPKDQYSFRNAAQLDPIDAILFAALLYQVGPLIEQKRHPIAKSNVFSYRFQPTQDGGLFAADKWEEFWTTSIRRSQTKPVVLIADITDFYNQISHHSIETQLQRCGLTAPSINVLLNLLKASTGSISKGIPIGPHPCHLLAETALTPIDELLEQRGMKFCRYVDDIHVFCDNEQQAQVALFALAGALDQYHKLTLNRQKTRTMQAQEFQPMARRKAEDQPINSTEASILQVIQKYSKGPYVEIAVSNLTPQDVAQLSKPALEEILQAYLAANEPDYIRLRYFIRRLAQVGVPGAIEFLVANIAQLLPAFAEVARYLSAARTHYGGSWQSLGDSLLQMLESPIATESEYIQVVLLGLFARIADLDHIGKLTGRFPSSGPSARREIVLAAHAAGADAWLRTLKTSFSGCDPWMRRALLFASRAFPEDERKFWLKQVKPLCSPLELEILEDSK
jgi:hypothetical protein